LGGVSGWPSESCAPSIASDSRDAARVLLGVFIFTFRDADASRVIYVAGMPLDKARALTSYKGGNGRENERLVAVSPGEMTQKSCTGEVIPCGLYMPCSAKDQLD
jgi:hypothetical protein